MVKSKINNLEQLLSKSFGNNIEIKNEKTTLLTAPGEHYGSIMLAIDLTVIKNGKEEVLNLVAKLIPANEMLRVAFDIPVTFKKEVFAYTETIPALVKFQKEFNVPEENLLHHIFPKCHAARIALDENKNQVDEDGVLIFENLKVQGYKTEDRLVGFDYEGAKIVIKDLARFHAVPIALRLLRPTMFEEKVMPCLIHNKGLEQLPAEVGLAFHDSIMEGALEIDELKQYLGSLKEIVDDALANPYVNRPPPNDILATMAHSDYWTSNTMLLRDENGKPVKNKMVDLQIMRYGSAIRDLVFFMFTSIINADLDKHCDDLIKLYYESFIDNIKTFNIDTKKFSWEAFEKELNEVAPTEVYHILIMLKPICTERGKVQNSLEDFQDTDWSRKDLLGPSHRRKLKDTVIALAKKNWL